VTVLAVLAFASVVATQEDAVEPRADEDRHGWAEARLGAGGLSSEADNQLRFGPSFAAAVGTGFKWLDLGVAGRYASAAGPGDRVTTFGIVPEVALRKKLGEGATLRFALTPQYVFAWGLDTHARYGAEGSVQLLFTVEESTKTFLRGGLGLRAGRWASAEGALAAGWTVGVDLVVRTFW